jgi:hypothetical protein
MLTIDCLVIRTIVFEPFPRSTVKMLGSLINRDSRISTEGIDPRNGDGRE